MVKAKRGSVSSTGSGQLTTRLPFPLKLYEMLEDAEEQGFNDIVSWNSDGNGFMVHDTTSFVMKIIPSYYNCTKYKSFQRQLSLYGFTRVTSGDNKGLRGHKNFIRGCKELCRQMKPVASGGGGTSNSIPMTTSSPSSGSQTKQQASQDSASIPTISLPQSPNSIVPTTSNWNSVEAIPKIPASIETEYSRSAPACPPHHQPMIPPAPLVSVQAVGVETRNPSVTTTATYNYARSTTSSEFKEGSNHVAIISSDSTYHPTSSASDYRPTNSYPNTVPQQVSFHASEEGDVGFFEGMPFFLTERKNLAALIPALASTASAESTPYGSRPSEVMDPTLLGPFPVLPFYQASNTPTQAPSLVPQVRAVHSIADDTSKTSRTHGGTANSSAASNTTYSAYRTNDLLHSNTTYCNNSVTSTMYNAPAVTSSGN